MKLSWKRELLALSILVATGVIAVYYYPLLPDIVASHFDIRGKPDGWMTKMSFYFVMGGSIVFVYMLLTFLPFIDPLRKKIEVKFKNVLLFRDVLLMFLAAIFALSLEGTRKGILNVDLLGIALGLLFIVMGNYMPKIPQNWFLGIKTPWTISSEVVWKKTHILGGWLFTLSGVIYLICAVLKVNNLIPLSAILATALISVVYSFYLYKKLEDAGGSQKG
jgi:uncharacterized membrane protein